MRYWQRTGDQIEFVKFAARCVENARAANEKLFARFAADPIIVPAAKPSDRALKQHQAHLARIAPWLPKKVPHWMRPAI